MIDGDFGVVGEFDGVTNHVPGGIFHIRDGLHVHVLLQGFHNFVQALDVGVDLGDLIFQDIDVILQGCDVLVVLVQSVLEGLIGQFRRCTSGQQQGRTCQECK